MVKSMFKESYYDEKGVFYLPVSFLFLSFLIFSLLSFVMSCFSPFTLLFLSLDSWTFFSQTFVPWKKVYSFALCQLCVIKRKYKDKRHVLYMKGHLSYNELMLSLDSLPQSKLSEIEMKNAWFFIFVRFNL